MKPATDVTGVLGWGLRRYAWLISLFVIALGIVVPGLLERAPQQYEASAQVGPVRVLRLNNLDVLPRMGTDVFQSVPRSPEVKAAAGVPPTGRLAAEQLELVAAQDNIIFTVIGRGSSPAVARDIADVAAVKFVEELNLYSQPVGSFSVSRPAATPTDPIPRLGGTMALGIGIASGLIAGLGAVALLLLLRRPVIDPASAELEAEAPVLGRITLNRRGEASGMTKVCHRILSQPTSMLLLVGPPNARRQRRQLARELVGWIGRVRRVTTMGSREPLDDYGSASLMAPSTGTDELFILDDASPVEVATRPDHSLTLLVVPEGISRASLREQAQQYVDGGTSAVVLVRKGSRLSRLRHRRRPVHERPLPVTPAPSVDREPDDHRNGTQLPLEDRETRPTSSWVQD